MPTAHALSSSSAAATGPLKTLALEVGTLLGALLSPRQVIAEVEEWRALNAQADAIEAQQPARAAALRRQAARIGV
jgi:hypothetical protein